MAIQGYFVNRRVTNDNPRTDSSSLRKNSGCSCFWVAQRFTAAITNLFSAPALAAAVTLRREKDFFPSLLEIHGHNVVKIADQPEDLAGVIRIVRVVLQSIDRAIVDV